VSGRAGMLMLLGMERYKRCSFQRMPLNHGRDAPSPHTT
jgi:hypothetical protein